MLTQELRAQDSERAGKGVTLPQIPNPWNGMDHAPELMNMLHELIFPYP